MATLNFAQRVMLMENRSQGEINTATDINTSPLSRIYAAVFKIVSDIFTEDLNISTVIDNGGTYPTLTSRGVSANQLKQFARNIRDLENYQKAFIYGILDEQSYINADTDNKLKNCIQKTIWFYAKDIVI